MFEKANIHDYAITLLYLYIQFLYGKWFESYVYIIYNNLLSNKFALENIIIFSTVHQAIWSTLQHYFTMDLLHSGAAPGIGSCLGQGSQTPGPRTGTGLWVICRGGTKSFFCKSQISLKSLPSSPVSSPKSRQASPESSPKSRLTSLKSSQSPAVWVSSPFDHRVIIYLHRSCMLLKSVFIYLLKQVQLKLQKKIVLTLHFLIALLTSHF